MAAVKCSYLLLVGVIAALLTIQLIFLSNSLHRTEMQMKSHDQNDSSHRYRSVFMLPASIVVDSLFPIPLSGEYTSQYIKTKQLRSSGVNYEQAVNRLRSSLPKGLRIITINYKNLSLLRPFHACLIAVQWENISSIGWQESIVPSRCRNLTRTAVVVYQSCTPHSFPWVVSHHNIYQYYDSVIACGKALSAAFPGDIIAWQAPSIAITKPSCEDEATQEDLVLIHRFLIDNHVRKSGIIVLMPSPEAKERCSNHGFNRLGRSTSTQHEEQLYSTIMDDLVREVLRLSSIPFDPHSYNEVAHDTDWCTSMLKKIKMDQKHLMSPSVEHNDLSPLCSKYVFTRKFHPQCHPPSSEVRAVLVTGLGGSGTHFIANHLRSLGWRLHHEGIDDDGAVVSSALLVPMSAHSYMYALCTSTSTELVLLSQRPHAEHDLSIRKVNGSHSECVVP